jgi:hypothetical protein
MNWGFGAPDRPEAVGGEDMREGSEHTAIGGLEVAGQLFGSKPGSGVEKMQAGPRGVIDMRAQDAGRDGHRKNYGVLFNDTRGALL